MAYKQKNYTYNDKLSKEENVLLDRLYKLRLSHMAEELEHQFLNPNTELEDFHTRISSIINYEWDQRQTKKFNQLKTKATLKEAVRAKGNPPKTKRLHQVSSQRLAILNLRWPDALSLRWLEN